jgi:UDP-N-acetylmuramate: L-alanyl-gamma-D-glutamyl-meso-diaminopimelate ligase
MKKHIHFIGICGVAMSALAILWKKKGWYVTGSDVGFYPPISTHLKKNKIEFYPGWHPEKIGRPDLVVVGNVAGSENPEYLYVKRNNLTYCSYPELIAKYLIKNHSIVCAGTYGKTSNTVLLSWILNQADFKPSYMFGGLSLNLTQSADDEGGDWSVVEGDEYKTGRDNPKAKFFAYRPTHLLLTAVYWDHLDVYPTEKSFFQAFQKLTKLIPDDGLIVCCNKDEKIKEFIKNTQTKTVSYGRADADYVYHDVVMDTNGLNFKITNQNQEYKITSPIIGEYMAENICGSFALAKEIGVPVNKIITAITKFQGIKRRLELRGEVNEAKIYDDIAHSPLKAKFALETIKKIHSGNKIIAIFEPNTGNRQITAQDGYDQAFTAANEIIIPRLTQIKKGKEKILEGSDLATIIHRTHPQVKYIDDDQKLIKYLRDNVTKNGAVIFLGSHGFRGMIEELSDQTKPTN